jgi:hypothetical protein
MEGRCSGMSGAPDSPALPQNTVSDALVVRRTWWAHGVPRAHRADAALMIPQRYCRIARRMGGLLVLELRAPVHGDLGFRLEGTTVSGG